jgi:hypothetical protein
MLWGMPTFAEQKFNTAPVAKYEFIDLSAYATDNADVININGGIKNYSYAPIQGHAVIYILDNHRAVLQAIETEVNGSASFRHGQTGLFDATVNVSGFSNVQSVSVEFVMKQF